MDGLDGPGWSEWSEWTSIPPMRFNQEASKVWAPNILMAKLSKQFCDYLQFYEFWGKARVYENNKII